MNEFDEIIAGIGAEKEAQPSGKLSKEEWAAKKQQEQQEIYDMVDKATELVTIEPGVLQGFLDIQSRFDRYSARNALLVAYQDPEATRLGTFEEWKGKGVSIRRGESAIKILVPGKEYTRGDGKNGVNFKVGRVFDISQTTAIAASGSVSHDPKRLLEALIRSSPCGFGFTNEPDMDARYSRQENKIIVRQGMSPHALFQSITREIAGIAYAQSRQKGTNAALDAFCVSYILCKRFGVPTEDFSFEQVSESLKGLEPKAIQNRLKRIRDTAGTMTDKLRQVLEPERKQPDRGSGAR